MPQDGSLEFEDVRELLAPYWNIERIGSLPFRFIIEPYPALGPGVCLARQSGFVVKSLPNPEANMLAVCKILHGDLSFEINGERFHLSPTSYSVYLATNRYPDGSQVEVVHDDVEFLFFNVCTDSGAFTPAEIMEFSKAMVARFKFSFEDIYDAVNIFNGFGPLRRLGEAKLSEYDNSNALCLMLKNFHEGNFGLKNLAYDLGVSLATVSRLTISGRTFKEWSDAYKISKWKRLRGEVPEREIANMIGYSDADKMRQFLKRTGALTALSSNTDPSETNAVE